MSLIIKIYVLQTVCLNSTPGYLRQMVVKRNKALLSLSHTTLSQISLVNDVTIEIAAKAA